MKRTEIKLVFYAGALIAGFGNFLILSSFGWKAFIAVALLLLGYSLMQPEAWILNKELWDGLRHKASRIPNSKYTPHVGFYSPTARSGYFSNFIKVEESKLNKRLEEAKKRLTIAQVKEAQKQINEILKNLETDEK